MTKNDPIYEQYEKELRTLDKYRLKFCPVHILLGCACGGCPVKGSCVRCNPGSALGIDHQTVTKDEDGNRRFTFRPYKTGFGKEKRELLKEFCDYFKFKLEILDVNTYCAEVGDDTLTVHITPTDESLRFRRGGDVLGTPWYGKDSPLRRYKRAVSEKWWLND